jgi:hypothetical protein
MLLYGKTEHNRRSTIQTEFNRLGGFPRVLIAQSQVGKEGLNLHKACKTVLLFNADWNPGVIEQQIGRVDRYESLWQKEMEEWIKNTGNSEPPVIEVIQLHFSGTYDEIQWEKYKERSQTLMFHLFGSLDKKNNWSEEDSNKIISAMPNFSPENYLKRN